MTPLQAPSVQSGPELGVQPESLTPSQQVYFYDPDRWEEFVREWATTLAGYVQIKRLGGPNDRGADIAAFATEAGFEGQWDCFQCKHYAEPLAFSDVLPELIKVFRHASAGDYTLPRKYVFLAPRSLSGTMNRLISAPTELRAKFLREAPSKLTALGIDAAESASILSLASGDAFTRFASEELVDVLAAHRTTPYFATRFGTQLPRRYPSEAPPTDLIASEARYVEQLLEIYQERWEDVFERTTVATDPRSQAHFQRQRVRFFEAEALKAYARDSVPAGTFEAFQEAIFSGVIDVVDMDHPDGWTRLQQAMTTAGGLNLTSHALVAVASQNDLRGVCHQLANDDRVNWMGT